MKELDLCRLRTKKVVGLLNGPTDINDICWKKYSTVQLISMISVEKMSKTIARDKKLKTKIWWILTIPANF